PSAAAPTAAHPTAALGTALKRRRLAIEGRQRIRERPLSGPFAHLARLGLQSLNLGDDRSRRTHPLVTRQGEGEQLFQSLRRRLDARVHLQRQRLAIALTLDRQDDR